MQICIYQSIQRTGLALAVSSCILYRGDSSPNHLAQEIPSLLSHYLSCWLYVIKCLLITAAYGMASIIMQIPFSGWIYILLSVSDNTHDISSIYRISVSLILHSVWICAEPYIFTWKLPLMKRLLEMRALFLTFVLMPLVRLMMILFMLGVYYSENYTWSKPVSFKFMSCYCGKICCKLGTRWKGDIGAFIVLPCLLIYFNLIN